MTKRIKRPKASAKALGRALKASRQKSKLTQEFIAKRVGVTQSAISGVERGESEPTARVLLAWVKELPIYVDPFMWIDGLLETKRKSRNAKRSRRTTR